MSVQCKPTSLSALQCRKSVFIKNQHEAIYAYPRFQIIHIWNMFIYLYGKCIGRCCMEHMTCLQNKRHIETPGCGICIVSLAKQLSSMLQPPPEKRKQNCSSKVEENHVSPRYFCSQVSFTNQTLSTPKLTYLVRCEIPFAPIKLNVLKKS